MYIRNKIVVLIFIVALAVGINSMISYAFESSSEHPTHQYITNQSGIIWSLNSYEIKSHIGNNIYTGQTPEDYNTGDKIIHGSSEEDYTGRWLSHFWEVDNPKNGKYTEGLWTFTSSYDKAREYWITQVIPLYVKGDYNQSYYWLGRVAHLLEDSAVPAHMHKDAHWGPFGTDSLEIYAGTNYTNWHGSAYFGDQYNYESLPNMDSFDWSQVDAKDKQNIELFRLFWYTAQKTQYYASNDENGNSQYRKLSGSTLYDLPDMWAGEGVTIINNSADVPANISKIANATIPHAMKAVAGLYRLFDDAVRIDWPTENHDYRRTSFTLLKGDMGTKNQVEKTAFVLGANITQEQVFKPIVADIDGNGAMETVNFVHNTVYADKTDIYAVETKNKKPTLKWKQTITGGATMFPGTLADLDGTSGSRKELITGVHNNSVGKVVAYNIDSSGKSITQRWSYTLNPKWSPLASENVIRYDGGTAAVDIDLDGKNEIILADVFEADPNWPGAVYVLKDNSGSVSLFANYTFGSAGAYATVSAADVDGDSYPEIFVPGMYGMQAFHYNTSASNYLNKMWSNTDARIESSPVIADVDMDNEYEIVYTTSNYVCATGKTCYNKVYVRDAKTGTSEREISISNLPRPTPSVANLDSDSNLEVVVIAKDSAGSYGDVYCYDAVTGNLQWTFNLSNQLKTSYMSPSIADIDNDGKYNVVLAENNGDRVFVLKEDGTELFNYKFEGYIDNAIAIADVDQDGVAELALKRAGSPITLFSTMSSYNKPPELNHISNITAIAGETVNLNIYGEVNATDPNENDTISFGYSAPFNNSGLWQTTVNDTGNYSILIEATDGNLSNYQYVDVIVFNANTTLTNDLIDSSPEKLLNYSETGNQTIQIRLPKNATVIYSKITLEGLAPQ